MGTQDTNATTDVAPAEGSAPQRSMKDKAIALGKKLKLDSHHAIERFGVLVGVFALSGVIILTGSGVSAFQSNSENLADTALYTSSFTTSRTELKGEVDGVYRNEAGDRALVMMHFPTGSAISYNAADYRAFLLGTNRSGAVDPVTSAGVTGELHVFGSTGYMGVLLEAEQPFERQILDLTMRAENELKFDEDKSAAADSSESTSDDAAADATFDKYDQWRIFMNPGGREAKQIPALDQANFDPARAYYDVVLSATEAESRTKLDQKLQLMRTNLSQIETYTTDLHTTKVDGLYLRPPMVPESVASDAIIGESASENADGVSTLELDTDHVVPGGFDLAWRERNVYDGYLDEVLSPGESYIEFLNAKRAEGSDGISQRVSDIDWVLSDGTDLKRDFQTSDVAMRPLMNVMNNLSQAYQDYGKNKAEYQSTLMLDLLRLEVQLRDVRSNSTRNADAKFLVTLT